VSSYAAYAYMELFTYYASEEAGSVEVCVVMTGHLNSPASVRLRTRSVTARCEFIVLVGYTTISYTPGLPAVKIHLHGITGAVQSCMLGSTCESIK